MELATAARETDGAKTKLEELLEKLREDAELDFEDRSTALAFKEFCEEWEKQGATNSWGEVVHVMTAPEVIQAVLDYFKADILENRAIHEAKVAAHKRSEAFSRIRSELAEYEGYFTNQDARDQIAPELLAVVRDVEKAQFKKIIESSLELAKGEGNGAAGSASFPESLGGGIGDFARDLVDLIETNGEQGRLAI